VKGIEGKHFTKAYDENQVWSNDSIGVCPNCHSIATDMWEVVRDEDDSYDVECDCGMDYTVTKTVSVTYYSTLKESQK